MALLYQHVVTKRRLLTKNIEHSEWTKEYNWSSAVCIFYQPCYPRLVDQSDGGRDDQRHRRYCVPPLELPVIQQFMIYNCQ